MTRQERPDTPFSVEEGVAIGGKKRFISLNDEMRRNEA